MQLPENSYWGQLIEVGLDMVGQKQTSAMKLTFDIIHEANGNADNGWSPLSQPARRSIFLWLSEAACEMSNRQLDSIGFNGGFRDPQFDQELTDGIELICTHEEYNNKTQERWTLAKWDNDRERTPPDDNTIRTLEARYKTQMSASKKPAGVPPAPPNTPDPALQQKGKDGIPF